MNGTGRTAILVTSHPGQLTVDELDRLAAADEHPRKDYVELAKMLEADVIDVHHMNERAFVLARGVSRWVDTAAGQVLEVFGRQRGYRHILAWSIHPDHAAGLSRAAVGGLYSRRRWVVRPAVQSDDTRALVGVGTLAL